MQGNAIVAGRLHTAWRAMMSERAEAVSRWINPSTIISLISAFAMFVATFTTVRAQVSQVVVQQGKIEASIASVNGRIDQISRDQTESIRLAEQVAGIKADLVRLQAALDTAEAVNFNLSTRLARLER